MVDRTGSASGVTRRGLMKAAAGLSVAALLPGWVREAMAQEAGNRDWLIDAVEVVRVRGALPTWRGINRQYQAQPLHLYDRPEVYHDAAEGERTTYMGTQDFVKIRTRGGVEGLYGYCDSDAAVHVLGPLKEQLVGQNAMAGEYLWDRMYRSNRMARAGVYMKGISYLDCALWDVRGRILGVPVYSLLGGPTREVATCYGSCLGFSVEPGKAGPRAATLSDKGFKNQKWFLAYGPSHGAEGLALNVGLVRELREAVGPNVNLMFDAYQSWDLQYATAWAQRVEEYRPTWIEEAFPTADMGSFVKLAGASRVPVATGEHFFNRWEVERFLEAGAIQYVQSDPEWCGGVSELLKMCHLASVHGAKVVPHGHNIHAALHVVVSQSPAVCPLVEYLLNHMDGKVQFQVDPPKTTDGTMVLPTRPGFGIELDETKIESMEVMA